MKQQIRITRANFPGVGNFSWIQFFVEILKKKYDVIIDSKDPDILLYTNQFYHEGQYDYYTNSVIKGEHEYANNVKKIFISGEANPSYSGHLLKGDNYYCLGYEHIDHERYLRFPSYILDIYVLFKEGEMFSKPFDWLLENREIGEKKHFCSVVQASSNQDRSKLFDLIEKKFWIKSSGPWRQTIKDIEALNLHKYHNYSNPDYMGKIDGLVYRDKINFFKDCWFNIAFQYTNTPYLTQEKLVHAYAGNTIPVFYGNDRILEEGFNPNSFINGHSFSNFEEMFEFMSEVYNNRERLESYFKEPIFTDNKLPTYFNEEYILEFFNKVIND